MNAIHHVAQYPKEYLSSFVHVLAEKYNPMCIYCFAKCAESGTEDEDFIVAPAKNGCRYFLLMILDRESRIEHHVQDFVNEHFDHGSITILVQSSSVVKRALYANNRFYISVIKTAELLFYADTAWEFFKIPEFVPTHEALRAAAQLEYHLQLASGFEQSAKECLRSSKYQLCTFMVHQVVEQCCIALIRIHLGYRSDIHNLRRLLHLCDCFSPVFSEFFIDGTEDAKRLFELLMRSYSAARYHDDFYVEQEDAVKLYCKVEAFLRLTEKACRNKIGILEREAEEYQHNKTGTAVPQLY